MRPFMRASVVGRATGLAGTVGVVRRDSLQKPHSAAQTPDPGPGQMRKQLANTSSLYPFVAQLHSNIFIQKKLSNRNRKQKYHMNLTGFLLRCGQSRQNMKLFLTSGLMSDSDLVSLRCLSVPE